MWFSIDYGESSKTNKNKKPPMGVYLNIHDQVRFGLLIWYCEAY